ncbi:MAG: nascent polypeptide-associated complex protein [Thermoplasmatota archaeon]
MIPGMGGMDPRQMGSMMKRLGIQMEDLDDVEEIVIRTPAKEYVFTDATVSIMKAQGSETYTINGTPKVADREVKVEISPEDIAMVVDQCGVSEDEARAALEETGDLAEAIVKLSE